MNRPDPVTLLMPDDRVMTITNVDTSTEFDAPPAPIDCHICGKPSEHPARVQLGDDPFHGRDLDAIVCGGCMAKALAVQFAAEHVRAGGDVADITSALPCTRCGRTPANAAEAEECAAHMAPGAHTAPPAPEEGPGGTPQPAGRYCWHGGASGPGHCGSPTPCTDHPTGAFGPF